MRSFVLSAAMAFSMAIAGPASAESFSGADYEAKELLVPCQESDNDARFGAAAEAECEQYIMGFVDALAEIGAVGDQTGICPPEQNTADEVRWAYMRWVHADYSSRISMPAADAMLATLKEHFACSN